MQNTELEKTVSNLSDELREIIELELCKTRSNDDELRFSFIGVEQEGEAWLQLIDKANAGQEPQKTLAETLRKYAPDRYRELNNVFVKRLERKDLPCCTRCKVAEMPANEALIGLHPDLKTNVGWFRSKEGGGWHIQVQVQTPFLGFDPLSSLKELPYMSVGAVHCPECHKEYENLTSKLFDDM